MNALPAALAMIQIASPYAWLSKAAEETIATRFAPPEGFRRVPVAEGTFGLWLRGLPLKPGKPPVHLFDGRLKANQSAHAAVVDIDVGSADLQQCADAVMRLRAEYLLQAGREEAICFRLTSGEPIPWARWKNGARPTVRKKRTSWHDAKPDGSYESFRRYLDAVFAYAGSASLALEMTPVADVSGVEPGDAFIVGGWPGHAVLVVDVAEDGKGHRAFLLAQSYMPAQEIHVLNNPGAEASPWYRAEAEGKLKTPEWTFDRRSLRRFQVQGCPPTR